MRVQIQQRPLPWLSVGLLAVIALVALWALNRPPVAVYLVLFATSLGALGAFWLARNFHVYALVGGFAFLTILRPLPTVGDAFILGRAIDLIWLGLSILIFLAITGRKDRPFKLWRGSNLLLAMTVVATLSLLTGLLFLNQPVIIRDLFELFRYPYYFLVMLVAMQALWRDWQLRNYLYKPMLVALWVTFLISILQAPGFASREFIEYVYTPKSAKDILIILSHLGSGESVRIRTSGTFANPNWYGIALALMIPFLLAGWSMIGHRHLRTLLWVTAVACLAFIGFTGSRTALLAAMAALGLYFASLFWDGWQVRRRRSPEAQRWAIPWLPVYSFFLLALAMLAILFTQGMRFQSATQQVLGGSVLGVASVDEKWRGTQLRVKEVFNRSPVVGLGPSKAVDQYLGDNQYSKTFYRYGILGLLVWFAFWLAVWRQAFRVKRHARTPLQAGMARAIIATVPAFLLAGLGGAFFDATQIATLYLTLIGIGLCARGQESAGDAATEPDAQPNTQSNTRADAVPEAAR